MSDVGEVSPASVFAELQAGEWEDARSAASLPTRLKRQRELCSLTQEELAERSGISLRSIQMYEQRQKNTNRASAEAVYRLACALRCSMEGLLQFYVDSRNPKISPKRRTFLRSQAFCL